jgi:hypothetical protein
MIYRNNEIISINFMPKGEIIASGLELFYDLFLVYIE